MNLISNAIKYSSEDSLIDIRSRHFENILKLSVQDQGMGISIEDQLHLFERFFTGNNVNSIQGAGLGLHIIRSYAELMNGTVHCQSTPWERDNFSGFIQFASTKLTGLWKRFY